MSGLGAFSGVFNTKKLESHVFTSEDVVLISMNLNSFTKNSCYDIYAKLLPSLQVAFPTIPRATVGNTMLPPFLPGYTILDLIDVGAETENDGALEVYYDAFNSETKKYVRVDLLEIHGLGVIQFIYDLIDYFQEKQKGPGKYEVNQFAESYIKQIQNSLQKCIKIYVPKKYILQEGKNSNGEDLDNRTILIKLYFQKQEKRNDQRIMSQRGGGLITDVPRTPAGTQSANRLTNDFQQESESNVGSLIPPVEDGVDNPKNAVSAPMRMHWNNTDKVWEAGTTQVLARLLTDIDAAPITNVVPPQAMGGLSNSDFFDQDSSLYMGGFTTGLAIPLSMHQGNPNKVGPNIIECGDKLLEKVRAVNRSARSFSAGEQVLLNYINGEWLISSIGEATAQDVVSQIIDWSFGKYIADSDSYFKDRGFYFVSPELTGQGIYAKSITPDVYEDFSRKMFYNSSFYKTKYIPDRSINYPILDLNTDGINLDLDYFFPSQRYIINTTFDQLPPNMGGFINSNITRQPGAPFLGENRPVIDIINPNDERIDIDRDALGSVVFPFWGPVFTRGYKSVKNSFFDEEKITGNEGWFFNRFLGNTPVSIESMDRKNIPAEITSKIIDSVDLFKKSASDLLLTENVNSYRTKYCYPPFYESTPVSKNHVSFMPLYDTMVGHLDIWSVFTTIGGDRNYHKDVYRDLFNISFGDSLFGSVFHQRNINSLINTGAPSCGDYLTIDSDTDRIEHANDVMGYWGNPVNQHSPPWIPYDCYVKQKPTSIPTGSPRYFRGRYYGAECVGITSAVATIKKVGGGQINFQTNQYFGLTPQRTVTVDPGLPIAILPIGGGLGIGGGGSSVNINSFPQWGSSSDDVDSFGTTALHVRIFDYWPEEQTLFDPRYFAVLHFNPCGNATEVALDSEGASTHDGDINFVNGTTNSIDKKNPEAFGRFAKYERKGLLYQEIYDKYISSNLIDSYADLYMRVQGDDASLFSGLETLSYGDRPRYVDIEETSVDIREPTFDEASLGREQLERRFEGWTTVNGGLVSVGKVINSKTSLRPFTEWRINTIRRGQLLSGGDGRGFIYKYNVIGVNQADYSYVKRGTGFKVNDEIDLDYDITLTVREVDSNGAITYFVLAKKTELASTLKLTFVFTDGNTTWRLDETEQKNGEGLLPSNFTTTSLIRTGEEWEETQKKCYRVIVPSPGENGENAVIEFYSGIVWQRYGQDKPPKEHGYGSLTRLTLPSNAGQSGPAQGVKDTAIQLDSNNSGFYSAFFHFHNDITHTVPTEKPFIPGFLQYVNLSIT